MYTCFYDPLYGNLETQTYQGQTTGYEYDNYNLLKRIDWPDQTNTQFVSDAAGNRVGMTTSQGATYNFIYDTTAGIPAVLVEKAATQDAKLYIRTPDGRLIARVTATETPALDFYYHFDGLGSTIALTDADGNRITTYDYGLWGGSGGGLNTQPYQYVGQLGYYTHYQEPKLSYGQMLQLGVRYYEPGTGRFTQRDPIATAKASAYIYADNSPLGAVDPTGLHTDRRCVETCESIYLADLQSCRIDYNGCLARCWRSGLAFPLCVYFRCTPRFSICTQRAVTNYGECVTWCGDHACGGSPHHDPPRLRIP